MECKIVRESYALWYRVKEHGQIIGYHCQRCHDKIRRAPFFQNFKEKLKHRLCSNCGNKTIITTTKKGFSHERWYSDKKGGWWCNHCYHMMTYDPVKVRKRNQTRMLFKDKVIHIGKNPRTGVCSLCGIKTKTSMHHLIYDETNPLKHTIEICNSCHMKESMKIHGVSSLRWKTPIGGQR
jgi:hypothetical protein